MTGMGTRTQATQPSNVPAQLTPNPWNLIQSVPFIQKNSLSGTHTMYCEKSGNPAPAAERRNVFAAIAEAALKKEKEEKERISICFAVLRNRRKRRGNIQKQICVHDIIEGLKENREKAKTGQKAGQSRNNPVD